MTFNSLTIYTLNFINILIEQYDNGTISFEFLTSNVKLKVSFLESCLVDILDSTYRQIILDTLNKYYEITNLSSSSNSLLLPDLCVYTN